MSAKDGGQEIIKADDSIQQTNTKSIIGWNFADTLLANAIATGDGVKVAVANVASSWRFEYVPPETGVIPPDIKEPPLLNGDDRIKEIDRSFQLAQESLAVFAAHIPGFSMAGGAAFPMNTIIQAGITAEMISKDKVLLGFLYYFMKESERGFSKIGEYSYQRHGADKTKVVGYYQENISRLSQTWDLSEFENASAIAKIDKRVKSERA